MLIDTEPETEDLRIPIGLDDFERSRLAWIRGEARDEETDDLEDFDEDDFDDDFDDDFEEEQEEEYDVENEEYPDDDFGKILEADEDFGDDELGEVIAPGLVEVDPDVEPAAPDEDEDVEDVPE